MEIAHENNHDVISITVKIFKRTLSNICQFKSNLLIVLLVLFSRDDYTIDENMLIVVG